MVPVRVVLVHGRERVTREGRPGTRESRLVLLAARLSGSLVTAAQVLGELWHRVVALVSPGPEAARVVQVVVLELDEGRLAALGHRRARRALRTGRHRHVVEVLLEVGARATGGTGSRVVRRGRRTAGGAAGRRAAAGHAVRGRGTRRTGVARPEWAPQIREVERRRGAPVIHLMS